MALAQCLSLPHSLAAQDVVINEVLYDPVGPDEGLEFVEIYNPGEQRVSLRGLVLETGNGARENDWTAAMEWTSDVYVEPFGYVVIGEESVIPAPHFVRQLDLQNGPDACRLRRGTEVIDVAGWGAHAFAEYYETAPAQDVSSGASIGRRPDGVDTNNNSLDFSSLSPPSPGRRNLCIVDAGLVAGAPAVRSANPVPFELVELSVEVVNAGAGVLAAGDCVVEFETRGQGGQIPLGSATTKLLGPGQSEVVTTSWRPEIEGLFAVTAHAALEGDENAQNDTLRTCVRVGAGDVVVNEIMYAPPQGAPEWIELVNRSGSPVNIKGWRLEDATAKAVVITSYDFVIEPGGFVVVSQDKVLPAAASNHCGERVLKPEGSWPNLNNYSSSGASYADIVCVSDAAGCVSDCVAYEEEWCTRSNSSIERVSPDVGSRQASNWSSSAAASGSTPCAANSISEAARGANDFEIGLSSRVISPDGDGIDDRVVLSFVLPSPGARANFTVFDVEGRVVKRLLDQRKVGTVTQVTWDGRDESDRPVPVSTYIIHLGVTCPDGRMRDSKSTVAVIYPQGRGR
ncbi:MAG: lamin tail domain-containing protein [Candidatus Eisenbacteria bacterium]